MFRFPLASVLPALRFLSPVQTFLGALISSRFLLYVWDFLRGPGDERAAQHTSFRDGECERRRKQSLRDADRLNGADEVIKHRNKQR